MSTANANTDFMLADPGLAEQGLLKIDFAGERMPVLAGIREDFEKRKPLEGLRIAACLHVTTETANLCRALAAGGATLSLCASNPLSTKDDVAAAIHAELWARVFAIRGCDRETFYRQVKGALSIDPEFIADDGADLTATIHTSRKDLLDLVIGASEVTSTGVLRARNMVNDGTLSYPMVALNDADTKHLFDNRYGTGQNTIDGILRATNKLLAGSQFVVVGYGWCGRGVAMRARGMGARVIVVEVDPVRALEAVMDGNDVMPIEEAAAVGDIFVTVTGNRDAIGVTHLAAMKDGAIVCNSGHFDLEIDVAGFSEQAVSQREVRPNMVQYVLSNDNKINILAEGRLVGQAAAEAHPAEVMDMTFSTQALTIEYVAKNYADLSPDVQPVPREISEHVARRKLAALGITIPDLTPAQREYLSSWDLGT